MKARIIALPIMFASGFAFAGDVENADDAETAKSSPVIVYEQALKVPHVPRADLAAAAHS